MFRTTELEWDQISEFKMSSVGACRIALNDGRWVGMIGVEQTNWAWLTNRRDTREKDMIAELNKLLREYRRNRGQSPTPGATVNPKR